MCDELLLHRTSGVKRKAKTGKNQNAVCRQWSKAGGDNNEYYKMVKLCKFTHRPTIGFDPGMKNDAVLKVIVLYEQWICVVRNSCCWWTLLLLRVQFFTPEALTIKRPVKWDWTLWAVSYEARRKGAVNSSRSAENKMKRAAAWSQCWPKGLVWIQ